MNQYLKSYTVAVKHPDVSGFEHLDMLITRDKIATLEEQLTAEEKAKLATADQHLLNQANRFFAALSTITDLQQERQKRQPLPSHMTQLNKYSARITQPKAQGASQAMLYGTGLTEADMNKPRSASPACGTRATPATCTCNDLAAKSRKACRRPIWSACASTPSASATASHGHRRHELLAAIARDHRRLHRDDHGRPVVRRPHRPARLRQEHARLRHGHGAPQPPQPHGLRRHHPRRLHR
jgi:hypothetical protein